MKYGSDDLKDDAQMAWTAWLGFYNGMMKRLRLNKTDLIELSREVASAMGLKQLPPLQKKTIGKMGLQVLLLSIFSCNHYLKTF